jgi:two-component system sensor histidine kinase ResE
VVFEVSDTGTGIPQADLPYIFDHFYKADKARSGQGSGMGLGLTIAKKIVTAHQGRIEVSSTEGQGSTFKVFLPLTRARVQQA